jgi:glucose/arabinose dehydrogenase
MRKVRLVCLAPSVLLIAVPAFALQVNRGTLPPPYKTPSVNNGPRVIPRPNGAELHLPAGFRADVFAEGFDVPRFMALGPSQELLLADSSRHGAVYLLWNNGKERRKLIDGLDRPYGLAFWKDYLYVAETTALKRYKYDAKGMRVASRGEEVVSMAHFSGGHWTRTVLFDRRGEKMYLTIGSGSNVSTGEDPRRAAINRYNPDGSGHEIFASGLRNVIGLRWYPGTDTLWAAVQERDALGDDLVPDYFTSVRQGGFYGWPYAYAGPNEDPRHKGERPDLVQKTIAGDVLLGSHVAVLDFIFYTGRQFPKQYQGSAFLAFHGSWNRSRRVGYEVAWVPFRDGKPSGGPQEFLTGFLLSPDKREVWGRPVGLLEMPDGSLLVSDDGGGKIWRITYRG